MSNTKNHRGIAIIRTLTGAIVFSSAILESQGVAFAQTRALADFNGDGVADLAVGAPGTDRGRGTVSVFLGVRGFGLQGTPTMTFGGTVDSGENYGAAVAAADLNDDGLSELIVGAPEWNSATGRVEIIRFFRRSTGLLYDRRESAEFSDIRGRLLLLAEVTRDAVDTLGVQVGHRLHALVKSVSIELLAPDMNAAEASR